MFNKGIISIFIINVYITIFCSTVQADNQYTYVPKKGYIVDIKELNNNIVRNNIIKELNERKTQDDEEELDLFETIKIPTPEIWKKKWEKEKPSLYKRYQQYMEVPNPKHNETVYQLMVMSRNAYVPTNSDDWVDLTKFGWKIQYPFGWNSDPTEDSAKRVRGYIFEKIEKKEEEEKKTLVVTIKGTSAGLFGIGGPTADFDKYNDNMMFSCCCAVVDISWKAICDCHSGIPNTCESRCLREKSTNYENSYYRQLSTIYNHVEKLREEGYEVYYTGHSLGGALASISGLANCSPVFTYEAPGEAQFAERIGIKPPVEEYKNLPIYHFGNNGDPIYMGKCTGITSTCYYSGFAMETKCHVGQLYMFDLDKNRNNPDNDNSDEQPVDNPKKKDTNDTPTKSYSKTKRSPVFLKNKSSIDEHQFHMFMEKSEEEKEQSKNEDIDPSFWIIPKNPFRPPKPSNPNKLNMLHHRIDYVITLLKRWEGPWPESEIQDKCKDCEDWTFIDADGDEGRTDPLH